jgi:serine O-acetyltransferase
MNEDISSENRIADIIDELCRKESYESVYHRSNHHDVCMPSISDLAEIVELLKSIIFPGFFVHPEIRPDTMRFYLGSTRDRGDRMFSEQIRRGFCFSCTEGLDGSVCQICESRAKDISNRFIEKLPYIRHMLALDSFAAFEGDPAAKNVGETIFCYPSILALTHHRISHELYQLEVPLIPRIISEMAHSKTGIDINPGAEIGESFFIDHGTGTVIGETCIIGKNVRIYQGVTLGAKSFPMDELGNLIKGIPRHPLVEDNVIIYSGATILGRVTIGKGAEIGGNVWLTTDVLPGSKVLQKKPDELFFDSGSGI